MGRSAAIIVPLMAAGIAAIILLKNLYVKASVRQFTRKLSNVMIDAAPFSKFLYENEMLPSGKNRSGKHSN